MSDIDKKIKEALGSSEESEALFVEPNFIVEVATPFRGKRKWMNAIGLAYGIIGISLAVWAGIRFFETEVVVEQLRWGGLSFLGLLFVSFLKVYFWMEMYTNRILREVKRVELLFLQKKD